MAAEEWARRAAVAGRPGAVRAELVGVEYIDPDRARAELGWRHRPIEFRRARSKPGDDGMARPHGAVRLTFDRTSFMPRPSASHTAARTEPSG